MKKDWATAERHFSTVVEEFSESKFTPEAVYYRGVCRYSLSHEKPDLTNTATELRDRFEGSEWQLRSIPWLPES